MGQTFPNKVTEAVKQYLDIYVKKLIEVFGDLSKAYSKKSAVNDS